MDCFKQLLECVFCFSYFDEEVEVQHYEPLEVTDSDDWENCSASSKE